MRALYAKNACVFALVCAVLLPASNKAQISYERKPQIVVSSKSLNGLKSGMKIDEVEHVLGARGNLQFRTSRAETNMLCVAYNQDSVYGRFFLLFINDLLSKICEPPPSEMKSEVEADGTIACLSIYKGADVMINEVLMAPNLIGTTFAAVDVPATTTNQSYDYGLAAAYLITRALFGNKSRETKEMKVYDEMLSKYDPFKITLSEPRLDVELRLGTPQNVEELKHGKAVRYYGSIKYGFRQDRELMWLAIIFEQDRVDTILAGSFLDYRKIYILENEWHKGR